MEGNTDTETHGFPPGYFIIRSVANGRVFDVKMDDIEDGTEITLWPEKEKSLVESRRDPHANNQVFFIDTSGALCSRSAGHALDIEGTQTRIFQTSYDIMPHILGDRLVLRHRRPVSYPFPNSYATLFPNSCMCRRRGRSKLSLPLTRRTHRQVQIPRPRGRTKLTSSRLFLLENRDQCLMTPRPSFLRQ
ncbi:hypothetical protein BD779DRAFT_62171 [Infundibulicybe gibba]|nr:hypothetical protein BD779DRAFT_62171 [Infundibulicybe gibba]